MAKRRAKKRKNGRFQIVNIFVFFLVLRVMALLLYESAASKYMDVFSIFLAFILLRQGVSGVPLLFWAWLGGLAEDIFSGTVIGVNGLSKLTVAGIANIASSKIEIANVYLQIPFAIIIFALDVFVKYLTISVMGITLNQHTVLTLGVIKVCVDTVIFIATCAILR